MSWGYCCLCAFPPTSRKDLKSLTLKTKPDLGRDGKNKGTVCWRHLRASAEGQGCTILKTVLLPSWEGLASDELFIPLSLHWKGPQPECLRQWLPGARWAGLWCLSTWSQADAISEEYRTIQR